MERVAVESVRFATEAEERRWAWGRTASRRGLEALLAPRGFARERCWVNSFWNQQTVWEDCTFGRADVHVAADCDFEFMAPPAA